jgi:hypothetical protein
MGLDNWGTRPCQAEEKMGTTDSRSILCTGIAICAAVQIVAFAQGRSYPVPLPETSRVPSKDGYVFDKPGIVIVGLITQVCQEEQKTIEGESLIPMRLATQNKGVLSQLLRVNERQRRDPDLRDREFVVLQGPDAIRIDIGKLYLLLLDPDPLLSSYPRGQRGGEYYRLSTKQGGFEVVGGRLRTLRAGGELDAYNGRLLSDAIAEIQKRK